MKLRLPKILTKGGSMPKIIEPTEIESSRRNNQTAIWIATTVVFALLFFLSSVLDMKVKVTFGQGISNTTTSGAGAVRTTTPAPAGGIASQVGGC